MGTNLMVIKEGTLLLLYNGKVWQVESLVNLANHLRFTKLKPSKLVVTIDNTLVDLFIRQTFFRQTLEKSGFAKHSPCQTFLLYSIVVPVQFDQPLGKAFCKTSYSSM